MKGKENEKVKIKMELKKKWNKDTNRRTLCRMRK
jgi:hypothetical protein